MIWFHIPLKSCWQMPSWSFTNRSHPAPSPPLSLHLPPSHPPSHPPKLPLHPHLPHGHLSSSRTDTHTHRGLAGRISRTPSWAARPCVRELPALPRAAGHQRPGGQRLTEPSDSGAGEPEIAACAHSDSTLGASCRSSI